MRKLDFSSASALLTRAPARRASSADASERDLFKLGETGSPTSEVRVKLEKYKKSES